MDALRAVEQAVDYIESHLSDPPAVEEIARAAGLSLAYFQRLFRAVVGETVGAYTRRRRLSRSVDALLSTRQRVLEIALAAGFESQEAYTRAFKDQFGVPPGRFRERGQRAPGIALPRITRQRLEVARQIDAAPPRIVELPAHTYVGMRSNFISVLSDDSDNRDVIPSLWKRFRARRLELRAAAGDDYGLCFPAREAERERVDEIVYMSTTGSECIPDVPPDLETIRVPMARYAVFEHQAQESALPDTILHVLSGWLPRSPYEYAGGVEIDRHPGDTARPIEYWVPIRDAQQ